MAVTEELFREALRQYALRQGNWYVEDAFIGIPHQSLPVLKGAHYSPPDEEAGDKYVAGDHDFHDCISLVDGLTYKGHQWPRVRGLAERELNSRLGRNWMAQVLCELCKGEPVTAPDFRLLSETLVVSWDDAWPEVDADMRLTGRIVGSEEGYASVNNEAMISESDAIAAGLKIVDGAVVA